jgi:prepilin-type N-terminal cleavage/methylation domain-containing protein
MNTKLKNGFALIEILVSITLLSIILLSVTSGVSNHINIMSGSRKLTKATIIAKNKMNDFLLARMRGMDIKDEPVEDYSNFTFSRETTKFEHPLLGPLPAKQTVITVYWKEKSRENKFEITYIFPGKI